MPPLAQEKKTASRDLCKAKKTKSRNGCGRCKLKRLKCDETTPACLQCTKRGLKCSGYEKTLKWSTKYEVFQPFQFDLPSNAGSRTTSISLIQDVTLTPDVINGFEALAAVLPVAKNHNSSPEPRESPKPCSPSIETPTLVENTTSPVDDLSPEEVESFPVYICDLIDPALFEGLVDTTEVVHDDLSFDTLADLDFLDTSTFQELPELDPEIEEIQRSPQLSSSSLVGSPHSSRSLLLDYYRIPSPSPAASLSDDIESILVQHYFKDVCVLFSSFDSILNPYRTTIGRIFQDSASIYYAIQSMAAAHLANTFPNMTQVGMEMQRKACECLQTELPLIQNGQRNGTSTFLSIILLGITTSWHESSALGEEFLTTARSLILPKLLSNSGREEVQRETQFFEESLIYWEMLMGWVSHDSISFTGTGSRTRIMPSKPAPAGRNREGKIVPHPWTGIAPTIQFLFAEVGRLVRRECLFNNTTTTKSKSKSKAGLDTHRRRLQDAALLNAATLEEDLLAASYPLASELADPGDERTTTRDFVVIAEAYRCTSLLELYHVFPSLLHNRLSPSPTSKTPLPFPFPTPRFNTPYEPTDTKLYLNSLALHILSTLESLPSSSGTMCTQPILLVAAASELRFVSSVDYFDVFANDERVRRARKFALKRLEEYALRLPGKPIRKCVEIVEEVWRRGDAGGIEGKGDGEVFWINVMVEMGWETVM
ncbi:fungal-specific transcription factor domain-containing protein, partial [Dendryphion nanum]